MSDFEKAYKRLHEFEGGYSNDVDDAGGKTRYGVTEPVARAHGYKGDMKNMPEYLAKEIYKKNYWEPLKCFAIPDDDVAFELFDIGVNMGIKVAGKFFQEALNLLTNSSLKVDGIIGTKTIEAYRHTLVLDDKSMVKCLNGLQFERYKKIVFWKPSQKKFFRGWLRRV